MPYLDKNGLNALWAKVKNWTNSTHAHSMTKGASSQDGLQLMLKDGSQTPVTLSTVNITKDDITALGIPSSALTEESDPTVPAWAKAASKPSYTTAEIAVARVPEGFKVSDDLDDVLGGLASGKASIVSPALSGVPTAPTAAAGTETDQLATCAFVATAVAAGASGAARFMGELDEESYAALESYSQGMYWVVSAAGTLCGQECEAGDMVFCKESGTGSEGRDARFCVVQSNIQAIPASVIDALS